MMYHGRRRHGRSAREAGRIADGLEQTAAYMDRCAAEAGHLACEQLLVWRRWLCYDQTMADIDALRQETKAGIARLEAGMDALRHETRAAIEAVKADLVKWLFGALIAQGGLIVALVKLL